MIRYTQEALAELHAQLGWDFVNDNFEVCIGGTQVYEIDGNNTKWSPTKGTRKYNKDAFIVIKRTEPITPSQPPITDTATPTDTINNSNGIHQGEHAPSHNT
ncbi:hypothetical protein T040910_064 [Synechococcus phage S-CAM3]|uniref:Uncharacterized protein n=1 Tax=Synechococcus phage S-CAM3 TaxID=1883366 RepID=A0A1D8KJJ2_9CAUD|nr:hypothetical protein BOW87_gp194 [Synechococcus phage S-CAM3]AOV58569.1 hypothetical protein S250808_064 [Synechococcus phage S-CAM3]AOV58808.1 hypothetical protein T040910_064 [Synechococcus phage S-CAM3]AOV59047.1 hypothetical protein C421010_064 [Synechococcus phage S-CAM3]